MGSAQPKIDQTSTKHRPHIDRTSTAHRPSIDRTSTAYRPSIGRTSADRVSFDGRSGGVPQTPPKLGRKNWQPSSSRTACLYGNCVKFFWSNSVPSFSCAALPHRILDGKFCTVSQQPQFSSHTASSPNLGRKIWPVLPAPFFLAQSGPKFLTQHPLIIPKFGRKNWQPSFLSATFSYRNCCKIFGPVDPQFSSRSSPSPKLGRKDWQPSSSGTHFPLQELRRKILVQLNPSFLREALPHPNLDGKIGSQVLQAHIFPYRNCVEKFWSS